MVDFADYLDSKGQQLNFLTGQPYSAAYHDLAKAWSKLPMYEASIVERVVRSMQENNVTILTAGTGVGKSVTVPKYMLRMFHNEDSSFSSKVAMTIPKQTTTQKAAEHSAMCLDVPIGTQVDFAFRGHKASPSAQLLYCTDGILLARILYGDSMLTEFRGIIIDEAHERPVPTDLLLFFLRNILMKRPEFRVVVMSATMDPAPYIAYFKGLKSNVIDVAGRPNFPIQSHYLDATPDKTRAVESASQCVRFLLDKTDAGDILVFVPKIKDATSGCRSLFGKQTKTSKKNRKNDDGSLCLSLYAKVDGDTMDLVTDADKFKKAGHKRRVIFSTNVAESSLTIHGIMYVIDTGLELNVVWDPLTHGSAINVDYVTKGQMQQRIGRTGRMAPGVAYHMYDTKTMESFTPLPHPKILGVSLDDIMQMILQHFTLNQTIDTFASMLTPPHPKQVVDAMCYLHFYGLITVWKKDDAKKEAVTFDKIDYKSFEKYEDVAGFDGELSTTGRIVSRVPEIAPMYALLLLWGAVFNCQREMVILASILESTGGNVALLWATPDGLGKRHLRQVRDPFSDHLTLVNVFEKLFLTGTKTAMDDMSMPVWNTVRGKVNKYYRIELRKEEQDAMSKMAQVEHLSPFENALLAARCFHLSCCDFSGKTPRMQNIFPIKTSAGTLERKFGDVEKQGQFVVYEELVQVGGRSSFNLVTQFPGMKSGLYLNATCPATLDGSNKDRRL
jgi:HrpA-like RNA helicase